MLAVGRGRECALSTVRDQAVPGRRDAAFGLAEQIRSRAVRQSSAQRFVSLLSDSGMPLEEISRLVGHRSTAVTELVYRKQIRPVLQHGATVMDQLFKYPDA